MARVRVQEFQQARENGRRERLRVFEKVERPQPSDGAERDFETARPVDAELWRVRVHPSVGVRDERLSVRLIIRVPVSAPQRHEVLMPVQLPSELLVARDARIKKVNFAPMDERRAHARRGFEMPINGRAEIERAPAQEIKLPCLDRFCACDQSGCGLRAEATAQLRAGCLRRGEWGEEARDGARAKVCEQSGGRFVRELDARGVEQAEEFLIAHEPYLRRQTQSLGLHVPSLRAAHAQFGGAAPSQFS